MRHLVLILATLTVASIVSVTGLISFIGLLAPHIAVCWTAGAEAIPWRSAV